MDIFTLIEIEDILKEVLKNKGYYSSDREKYLENIIDNMNELTNEALVKIRQMKEQVNLMKNG